MDHVSTDCGPLKKLDYTSDYANAFEVGRQLSQQRGVPAANQQYATDPLSGINVIRPYNPAQGASLEESQSQARHDLVAATCRHASSVNEGRAAAALRGAPGDVIAIEARIAAMDPNQRAAATQQADKIVAVLHGILATTTDLNERLRIARYIVARNPHLSLDPSRITSEDVTDAGIVGHIAQAIIVEWLLKRRGDMSGTPSPPNIPVSGPSSRRAFDTLGQILANPNARVELHRSAIDHLARPLSERPVSRRASGDWDRARFISASNAASPTVRIYNPHTGSLE